MSIVGHYMLFLALLLLSPCNLMAASPPYFCFPDLEGVDPPYCLGKATQCAQLNIIDCTNTDGCTGNLITEECTGSNDEASCSDFHGDVFGCAGIAGCQLHFDPPCDLDPFDIAITPFSLATPYALDELFCDTDDTLGVPINQQKGGCIKIRPSRDGEVTLLLAGDLEVGYTGCEMKVGGRTCQSCELCDR